MDGDDESGEDIDAAEAANARKTALEYFGRMEKESAEARIGAGDEKELIGNWEAILK